MDEAHERLLGWYKQGRYAFQLGRRYEPPDDMVLRKCYAAGWEDEINDHYPDDDRALDGVYEQLKHTHGKKVRFPKNRAGLLPDTN